MLSQGMLQKTQAESGHLTPGASPHQLPLHSFRKPACDLQTSEPWLVRHARVKPQLPDFLCQLSLSSTYNVSVFPFRYLNC